MDTNSTITFLKAAALLSIVVVSSIFSIKMLTENDSSTPVTAAKAQPEPGPPITPPSIVEQPKGKEASMPIVIPAHEPLQPKYVPVNEPAIIQNIRQAGKEYTGYVLGKVHGRASKKDWGIVGSVFYSYHYGMETVGKIIDNDGVQIIEERTFSSVCENVVVSEAAIGLALPSEKIGRLISLFTLIKTGDTREAREVGEATESTINALNEIKIPISTAWLEDLQRLGYLPSSFDVTKQLPMFTQPDGKRLLENKTVRITFVDGQGITLIEPINCNLSQKEIDIIKRTNFIMDHYLFPDRKVDIGDEWTISADTLSVFLDPRLEGKVMGSVGVMRIPDFTSIDGEVSKRLRLINGTMETRNMNNNMAVTGRVRITNGICNIPNDTGVVNTAFVSGYAEYEEVSTDHLLFEAKMNTTPRVEIKYEGKVSNIPPAQ